MPDIVNLPFWVLDIFVLLSRVWFFFLKYLFWLSRVFVAVRGLPLVVLRFLIVVASPVAVHGLGHVGSAAVAHSLSSPWHAESSGPGIEPTSPALAHGSLTTGTFRKPLNIF